MFNFETRIVASFALFGGIFAAPMRDQIDQETLMAQSTAGSDISVNSGGLIPSSTAGDTVDLGMIRDGSGIRSSRRNKGKKRGRITTAANQNVMKAAGDENESKEAPTGERQSGGRHRPGATCGRTQLPACGEEGFEFPAQKDGTGEGWICSDDSELVCLDASTTDGSFNAVADYTGDLPVASMQGRASLKYSAAGSVLRVRVDGHGQDTRGLLVGESLTAQVHTGSCATAGVRMGPLIEVACDDRGRCSGTIASEWIPSNDEILSGISMVVYDTVAEEPLDAPTLCADLAARVPNMCPKKSRPICETDSAELVVADGGGLACSDGSEIQCRRQMRGRTTPATTTLVPDTIDDRGV